MPEIVVQDNGAGLCTTQCVMPRVSIQCLCICVSLLPVCLLCVLISVLKWKLDFTQKSLFEDIIKVMVSSLAQLSRGFSILLWVWMQFTSPLFNKTAAPLHCVVNDLIGVVWKIPSLLLFLPSQRLLRNPRPRMWTVTDAGLTWGCWFLGAPWRKRQPPRLLSPQRDPRTGRSSFPPSSACGITLWPKWAVQF